MHLIGDEGVDFTFQESGVYVLTREKRSVIQACLRREKCNLL